VNVLHPSEELAQKDPCFESVSLQLLQIVEEVRSDSEDADKQLYVEVSLLDLLS